MQAEEIGDEEFEALVQDALDRVPDEFRDQLENVAVVVEDEPPAGQHLLGLYEGVPQTEEGDYPWQLPDVITIYQGPLVRMCADRDELAHEVYVTVVHELGHYFGLDDERLHELDWG
ncbi:metallopeptidase family protein [Actinomyces sp. F1_1611]